MRERMILDPNIQDLLKKPYKKSQIILSALQYTDHYFIKEIELRQYVTSKNVQLGEYSILVIFVVTNDGTVIMKYDEGYRGDAVFSSTVEMITKYSGFSSIINRAIIELDNC